jgi:transposase-like protein
MSEKPKSKKHYPPEFREKAVKLITDLGYAVEQVAEKLGCCKESVRRWKADAMPKLDPETAPRMELEENENKRLRKENARLKTEVDILKKATAYFARETMSTRSTPGSKPVVHNGRSRECATHSTFPRAGFTLGKNAKTPRRRREKLRNRDVAISSKNFSTGRTRFTVIEKQPPSFGVGESPVRRTRSGPMTDDAESRASSRRNTGFAHRLES